MANEILIGYGAGIATLLIGGFVGTYVGHVLTKNREIESTKKFERKLLRAIRTEIQVVLKINEGGIAGELRKVPPREFLAVKMEISQNYFTVYESNCSQIGKIDADLGQKIVLIYALMKGMIDAYRLHNRLLDQWQATSVTVIGASGHLTTRLVESTVRLQQADKGIQDLIAKLFAAFDTHGITL